MPAARRSVRRSWLAGLSRSIECWEKWQRPSCHSSCCSWRTAGGVAAKRRSWGRCPTTWPFGQSQRSLAPKYSWSGWNASARWEAPGRKECRAQHRAEVGPPWGTSGPATPGLGRSPGSPPAGWAGRTPYRPEVSRGHRWYPSKAAIGGFMTSATCGSSVNWPSDRGPATDSGDLPRNIRGACKAHLAAGDYRLARRGSDLDPPKRARRLRLDHS